LLQTRIEEEEILKSGIVANQFLFGPFSEETLFHADISVVV